MPHDLGPQTQNHDVDDNNLIVPGTPIWNYAVAQGRGTKEALQWTMGDWANRICPVGEKYEKTGAYENLKKYSEELGIELKTLINYREVSGVFSDTRRRVSLSFGIHHALTKYPHLIDKLPKTVREARQLVKDEDARLAAEAKTRAEEAARVAAEAQRLAEKEAEEARIRAEERARVEAEQAAEMLRQQQEAERARQEVERLRILKESEEAELERRRNLLPDDPDFLPSDQKSNLSVLMTFAADTAKLRIYAKKIVDTVNTTDMVEWSDDQRAKVLHDIEHTLQVVTSNLEHAMNIVKDPTSTKFSDEKIEEWLKS